MGEKEKKVGVGLVLLGAALAVGAVIAIPKFIDYYSSRVYGRTPREYLDDDDWGPEIVKTENKRKGNVK